MFKVNPDQSMELIRGDSAEFDIDLLVQGDEGQEPTEYVLQEGDVLTFTVKENTETSEVMLQKTGQHIEISPEDTHEWEYGDYVYDAELVFANGTTETVVEPNMFTVKEEVTF